MTNPKPKTVEDLDPAGVAAARAVAGWYLGYRSWADDLLDAYLNPEAALELLKKEKES